MRWSLILGCLFPVSIYRTLPCAILAKFSVVSYILLLFKLQNMRNLENICHIAFGTLR